MSDIFKEQVEEKQDTMKYKGLYTFEQWLNAYNETQEELNKSWWYRITSKTGGISKFKTGLSQDEVYHDFYEHMISNNPKDYEYLFNRRDISLIYGDKVESLKKYSATDINNDEPVLPVGDK